MQLEKKDDEGIKANEFEERSRISRASSLQRSLKKARAEEVLVAEVVRPRPERESLVTRPEVEELQLTPCHKQGFMSVVFQVLPLDNERRVLERLSMILLSSP